MKKIKIQSITDQRPFVMVYHDFLKSKLLDNHYQIVVYIFLKMFTDSNNQCFPSIKKLSKLTKISIGKVKTTINELEQKNIIIKENRIKSNGGKTSNLYTIRDFKELWNTENKEEVTTIINEYEEMKLISELRSRGYTIIKNKEEEPTSLPAKVIDVSPQYQNDISNDTSPVPESQDLERYTMNQIKQLFEYDILITDHSKRKKDIDIVFTILYDTLNWTKPTIRVDGQEKPSMIVISRLMKLEQSDLWYAIEKYHAQQERIKNVNAYLLTILYHAKEQAYLDLMNLGHHNRDF